MLHEQQRPGGDPGRAAMGSDRHHHDTAQAATAQPGRPGTDPRGLVHVSRPLCTVLLELLEAATAALSEGGEVVS